ncbi:dipeptide ABC transporter ATP-binding protein [Roseomonas haemaphysalidis]|uniref:ABC transporter ATP-binding protein n=1 Tax=Roseomonas haemaphysalidis TaxID=2768162 RepID=A0ABS3KKS5_9PROT|nr:ABC transporter ATP-binding protein [Roseomonas haemaphysalidis]MBO1078073.1 ABC transporter ATP-binding protein [Roseomonas haemaphysalidis]
MTVETLSAPAPTLASLPPLLEIENLHVEYGREDKPVHAVRGVTLAVQPGEVVAIVGESGSGKSTTAHAVIHLLSGGRVSGGAIRFGGEDITRASRGRIAQMRGSAIGLIPQDPGVALNPVLRVGEQVAEVLRLHGRARRAEAAARAVEILRDVGLHDPELRARQYPHELSGGMRQRVLIGIALACQPQLVIADEATSALDVTVQRRVLDLLAEMTARAGTAVLLITHDLGVAADRADRVVVMQNGQVVEQGPAREILERPQHPYTRALLAAAPGLATRRATLPPTPRQGMAAEAPPLLTVSGLCKSFRLGPGRELQAVRDVSFSIPRGQTFSIVGESGSGKSTTARMISRLETATRGSVLFDGVELTALQGEPLRKLRARFQLVYQNPYSSLDPRMSIEDILTEPLRAFRQGDRAARAARAAALLDQVALPRAFLARHPGALSGGQRQRVAIARALALRPDLLVLDEPVSALDVSVQDQILRLLAELQAEFGLTYLMISHDLAVVRQLSHAVGVMYRGHMVEKGACARIFEAPQDPYTQDLLAAIPGGRAVEDGAPRPLAVG